MNVYDNRSRGARGTPHIRRVMRRNTVRVLAVALAALPLTSCSGGKKDACSWMSDSDPALAKAPSTVVLVDASASVRGGAASPQGGTPSPVARNDAQVVGNLVEKIVEAEGTVFVGWFGGGQEVRWIHLDGEVIDWSREKDHPDSRAALREKAVVCLTDDIADAESAVPGEDGTDVLAAMRAGGQVLANAGGGERKLIVLTDGLATRGCADLRTASFREASEAETITEVCRRTRQEVGEHMLAGVHTRFVGLGRTAGSQPAPDEPQRIWLENLWKALCTAAGSAACEVEPTPVQTRTGSAVPRPDDPVIRYGSGQHVIKLPGAALFDPKSAVLRTDARQTVADAAVDIRSRPAAEVHVYGYVDPRGDPANNMSLSQARAEAVAEVLRARGVANVTAHGRGLDTNACPLAMAGTATSGTETSGTGALAADQELQCDRRVDIVVTE